MTRNWMLGLAAAAMLFAVGACSDDDEEKKDSSVADAGVDVMEGDMGGDSEVEPPEEAGVDATAGPQYSLTVVPLEISGRVTWGPAPPSPPPPTQLLKVFVTAETPDPTGQIVPDFIDSPTPPNCVGYKWSAGGGPNQTAGDAGKIKLTGHTEAMYVDADSAAPTPQALPATIECDRVQVGTSPYYLYDCGLPAKAALVGGSAIDDNTTMDLEVTGGADISAFTTNGITPTPIVVPTANFDLNQIDPAAITAEWETTTAPLVNIIIQAYLQDGSENAMIICSAIAALGSKEIPADALALIPQPTATNPLIMETALLGINPMTGTATHSWGTSLFSVGRGSFGISCRTPAGQCPAPAP